MAPRALLILWSFATVAGAQQAPPVRPVADPWTLPQSPQSSIVYARDGSIIGEIGHQFRTSVALSSMPSYLPQAFIAVEDQRFYKHNGVDLVGIASAVMDMVTDGRARGASTITQQLVGIVHPEVIDRSDRSVGRKLREQEAAREMEKRYTKDAILEAYLNRVDLGRNWFGVEAAARHYFGKSASRLTLAEAASLAALPQSPPRFDPIINPEANRARRNLVLGLMADQGYITRDVAERARQEPVVTAPHFGMAAPSNYFVDAVRKEAERIGVTVMDGGYRIHTTLDPVLQNAAVSALVSGTLEIEKSEGYKHLTMATRGAQTDYLQGLVVAMDPYTGEVRALVGGRNHALAPFNRATTALRQPGSAIKPLVYAKALELGVPIGAIVSDRELDIPLITGDIYTPGNADGKFLGPMTLREALVRSRNPIAVEVGLAVGMESVAELSSQLGITNPMMPVPSSAIGSSVVKPIDLVAAYSAFVNNGQVPEVRMITRIENSRGQWVYAQPAPDTRLALDPRAAFIVRDVLRDAVVRGTGTRARAPLPASVPVAGKTGTTNDNVDVWFLGMTPDLVAGVWLGFDRPKTIQPGAVGGVLAAPIWGEMMAKYYANRRALDWPAPPAGLVCVELDRETGELATVFTPTERRVMEYFLPGTEPGHLRGNPFLVPRWGPVIVP